MDSASPVDKIYITGGTSNIIFPTIGRFHPLNIYHYNPVYTKMASEVQNQASNDDNGEWAGDFDPFADPAERRVLFSTFDSFRCVCYLILEIL